jgi:hypothetical protein
LELFGRSRRRSIARALLSKRKTRSVKTPGQPFFFFPPQLVAQSRKETLLYLLRHLREFSLYMMTRSPFELKVSKTYLAERNQQPLS